MLLGADHPPPVQFLVNDSNSEGVGGAMASAILLKQLFEKLVRQDLSGAVSVAEAVVKETQRNGHSVLAGDLEKILNSAKPSLQAQAQVRRLTERLPIDPTTQMPLVSVMSPAKTLKDLVLVPDTQFGLDRVIREYKNRGVLQERHLNHSSKVLLAGPPGCGKTTAAHAIASALNLPLIYVRLDTLISSFLGETATNIRQVFEFYENNPCVLLFDEFDAVAKERNDSSDVGELKRVVSSFIQIMDQTEPTGIVVCATNHATLLDSAVWRRFDQVITFPKPDDRGVLQVVERLLPDVELSDEFRQMFVSVLSGGSFADIERVCLEAHKTAVLDQIPAITEPILHQSLLAHQKRVSHINHLP
jgi:SpoVK/Ycf46/Vps4 family AAA+-type ATPase